MKTFSSPVINKGQVLTHYYRIMNKNGGYTWVQTCATVVCSIKNADEQNIICVNYIISGKENCNLVLDQCQLGIIKREPIAFAKTNNEPKSPDTNSDNSRNAGGTKLNVNQSESKSTASAIPLDISCKSVERLNQNCDDEASSTTTSKRGRKRKVKLDAREDTSGNHSPPTNHNEMNNSDISGKDLESVISKHLPKPQMIDRNLATDSRNRQRSEDRSHALFPQQSAPMPATALLRQLYANRESVIRATTRQANYMFSDNSHQQSLPTPPNDSYDSQYLRKSGENFSNLVSYGAYPSMDYNNAMTPPSSVSPRDLTNHKTGGNYEYINLSSNDSRIQYQPNNTTDSNSHSNLPLKPQPYSIHQMDPTYSIDHQSQYFPYHSGFHLYHKGVYTPP